MPFSRNADEFPPPQTGSTPSSSLSSVAGTIHSGLLSPRSVLHSAASHGSVRRIKELLLTSASVDLNAKNACGRTPLHVAVLRNKLHLTSTRGDCRADDASPHVNGYCDCTSVAYQSDLLTYLLDQAGAIDINATDENGYTALHFAAGRGDLGALSALLATTSAIRVDVLNKFGDTPLDMAMKYCRPGVADHAIVTRMAAALLRAGASVDGICMPAVGRESEHCRTLVGQSGLFQKSRLLNAIESNNVTLLQLFVVEGGASINAPWHHVCPVDMSIRDASVVSPLARALQHRSPAFAKVLLDAGATLAVGSSSSSPSYSCSILHYAVATGCERSASMGAASFSRSLVAQCTRMLVTEYAMDVDSKASAADVWHGSVIREGYTPLQVAALMGCEGMCRLLLELGASVGAVGAHLLAPPPSAAAVPNRIDSTADGASTPTSLELLVKAINSNAHHCYSPVVDEVAAIFKLLLDWGASVNMGVMLDPSCPAVMKFPIFADLLVDNGIDTCLVT